MFSFPAILNQTSLPLFSIVKYCPLSFSVEPILNEDNCLLYLDGATLIDKSQYNQTVLGTGILATIDGRACYDFTNPNNRLFVPNNARVSLSTDMYQTPFTVEFWFRRQDVTSAEISFFSGAIKGLTSTANPPKLKYSNNNVYSHVYQNPLAITIPPSEWNHIAIVYVNQEMRVYFNGLYKGKSGYFDDTQLGYYKGSPFINEDQFVIGGDTTANYAVDYFARGYITKFIITKGIKYRRNFNPNTNSTNPNLIIELPYNQHTLISENNIEIVSENNITLKEE